MKDLMYAELVILFFFSVEIIANIYAYGFRVLFIYLFWKIYFIFFFKFYFKDRWLLFDAAVIVCSVVLVFLDIFVSSKKFSTISKIIRGIFRFLRIFLLFRKVNFKICSILTPIMCKFTF